MTPEQVELIVAERIAELERRIAPEALTVRDAAERLRLSVSRVRELIALGELPSFTIGASRRIDPAQLAAFLADRQRQPAAEAPATRSTGGRWIEDIRREAYGGA